MAFLTPCLLSRSHLIPLTTCILGPQIASPRSHSCFLVLFVFVGTPMNITIPQELAKSNTSGILHIYHANNTGRQCHYEGFLLYTGPSQLRSFWMRRKENALTSQHVQGPQFIVSSLIAFRLKYSRGMSLLSSSVYMPLRRCYPVMLRG